METPRWVTSRNMAAPPASVQTAAKALNGNIEAFDSAQMCAPRGRVSEWPALLGNAGPCELTVAGEMTVMHVAPAQEE